MIAALTDPWFEAKFYGHVTETGCRTAREDGSPVPFGEAQGLLLWCPCGYGKAEFPLEGGRPHAILVPFANGPGGRVPESHGPISRSGTHPRWTVSGSSLADLSCSPSIAVGDNPECWHGYITAGEVR